MSGCHSCQVIHWNIRWVFKHAKWCVWSFKTSRGGTCSGLAPGRSQLSILSTAIGKFCYRSLFFLVMCFSLWLKLLQLPLHHLWQLYPVHNHNYDWCSGSQLHGASNSFETAWCGSATTLILKDTTRGVVALSLCCRGNLSPRCLLKLLSIMPWVFLRWVPFS